MSDPDLRVSGENGGTESPLDLAFEEEPAVFDDAGEDEPGTERGVVPGPLLAAATAWADLVLVLAVCATAVAGIRLLGLPLSGSVLPWACGLGGLAWITVSAILLPTRRSWPGALVLGLVLPPDAGRDGVVRRLLLILLAIATVGLLSALASGRDPWADLVPERSL